MRLTSTYDRTSSKSSKSLRTGCPCSHSQVSSQEARTSGEEKIKLKERRDEPRTSSLPLATWRNKHGSCRNIASWRCSRSTSSWLPCVAKALIMLVVLIQMCVGDLAIILKHPNATALSICLNEANPNSYITSRCNIILEWWWQQVLSSVEDVRHQALCGWGTQTAISNAAFERLLGAEALKQLLAARSKTEECWCVED
uniref:Uncharacterized protein n=1 Tax=Hyaloperonospora arabidopsidis (strain Emoy2) TaxID=559515 RepID=M4BM93_HYAAE